MSNAKAASSTNPEDNLPTPQGERHVLAAEEELRLEVTFAKNSTCTLLLQSGSCELQGVELAAGKPHVLMDGGFKLALFTWHGCVIDVACDQMEISYTSDETVCNVAYVNTHAQLEAMRDQAAAEATAAAAIAAASGNPVAEDESWSGQGPRVLICGPPESGKTSLAKVLVAYACKLGRTPIFVDLDPADNCLGVPGTLAACPMHIQALSVESYATTGLPPNVASPLMLWHATAGARTQPDLFRAQVSALADKLDLRCANDDLTRTSGIIVNTNGWVQDEGFQLLLHTMHALRINVVLVMGHDRLYSMIKSSSIVKQAPPANSIKVIKVPRSGGVVSRDANFLRQTKSRSLKRYFYGDMVESPGSQGQGGGASGGATSGTEQVQRVPQLTPSLLQIPFEQVTIYQFSSISLSKSLLPVAAAQTTEAVQLTRVMDISDKTLAHHLLAVCHPQAVAAYEASGRAADLYTSGVAGFVSVERVVTDPDKLHLLSPCAGSLPSNVLLLGDVTWMD